MNFPHSPNWKVRAADTLHRIGHSGQSKRLLGAGEGHSQSWHEKQARKEKRRAERRHTPLGRVLNILGL